MPDEREPGTAADQRRAAPNFAFVPHATDDEDKRDARGTSIQPGPDGLPRNTVDAIAHNSLFKAALRRHAAGVCILSAGTGDEVNGMAVTAAVSFSAAPAAMLVCVNRSASICTQLSQGTRFCLSILGAQHAAVAQAFSRKPSGRIRFDNGTWRLQAGELPLLEDAPANIVCRVERVLAYGSHVALIGLVQDVRLGPETAASLVYRDGDYG